MVSFYSKNFRFTHGTDSLGIAVTPMPICFLFFQIRLAGKGMEPVHLFTLLRCLCHTFCVSFHLWKARRNVNEMWGHISWVHWQDLATHPSDHLTNEIQQAFQSFMLLTVIWVWLIPFFERHVSFVACLFKVPVCSLCFFPIYCLVTYSEYSWGCLNFPFVTHKESVILMFHLRSL